MTEEWRALPSAPSYEVSSKGRVRRRGRVLSQFVDSAGYCWVKISVNGVAPKKGVHALVCEAFNGPKPEWATLCAHNDGTRDNNVPGNVRWATGKQNAGDRVIHGTHLELDAHPRATITLDKVRAIRAAHAAEMGNCYVRRGFRGEMARKYGITVSAVKDILSNRSWKE